MPPQNFTESVGSAEQSVGASNHPSPIADDELVVDNKVYSALKLSETHPGGDLFVKAFAGRDATDAFISYHRRAFPHSSHTYALLRENSAAKKSTGVDDDYFELCSIVDKVLPRNKSFATAGYWAKIAVLLAVTVSLEFYIHFTSSYHWYLTAFLGYLMALIGLNIQHDANHGAISRNPRINRMLGITQNYIGGSSIDWIHQHVVQHHVSTNDVHNDPDIEGSILLRLNPLKPLLSFHAGQHLYVFLAMALFGFSVTYNSMMNIIDRKNFSSMSKMLQSFFAFETFTSILFFMRWLLIPFAIKPSIFTIVNIAPLYMVAGYYLSFFFIISHNFSGVHIIDEKKDPASSNRNSFLYNQVATSSNVGGAWLCFMNGGLNYQIEHHLFPRIQHSHYPTIAPVVREFCEKRGIPYVHFKTIGENVQSMAQHLFERGHDEATKNKSD